MNKMIRVNQDNFFDIAEAIHAVLTMWHDGKSSKSYSLLSQSQFKPSPMWSEYDVESENYYFPEIEQLARTNKWDKIEELMDNTYKEACLLK